MIKNILLTGATGFTGSHLLGGLLNAGYRVIVLKRSTSDTWRVAEYLMNIKTYNIDLQPLDLPFKENQIDCVIHLATHYVKFHANIEDVDKIMDFNITTATKILELAVEHHVPHFLNTGSFFEFKMKNTPIKEGDARIGYNLYASAKIAFDEITKYYAHNFDIKVIDLKLFSPYGEKDKTKVFVFLIKSLLENRKIDFSGGEQSWNFTYIKDIIDAYLKALYYFENDFEYETFNIGRNDVHSLRECVNVIENVSGKKIDITFGEKPYVKNEIFYANCDNSKAKKLLGWEPQYDLETGLALMYDHYKNNPSI